MHHGEDVVESVTATRHKGDDVASAGDRFVEGDLCVGEVLVGGMDHRLAPGLPRRLEVGGVDGVHVAHQERRLATEGNGIRPARIRRDDERRRVKMREDANVRGAPSDEDMCEPPAHGCSLRWHYPDQVLGSAEASTLSARWPASSPCRAGQCTGARSMSGSMKMKRATGTAARIASSASSMARLTCSAETSGEKMTLAATSSASGPRCSVCM